MDPQPVVGVLFDDALKHGGEFCRGGLQVSRLVAGADGLDRRQNDDPMPPGTLFTDQKGRDDRNVGGQGQAGQAG